MYEVLRFVEKGTECQPSIDCLQGELLIYYLRDNTQLDKAVLFEWFRQIAGEIRKYQQSKRGQNYRCLTPYSIVVTEEGELLLLNPDAQENEFVMKKMQQKAVRSHFIRPTASGSKKNCSVDLFGYGKILQFLLAYTEQIPELSRSEERRLERIIERCTDGGRRHYDKISQVIRDGGPAQSTESISYLIYNNGMSGGQFGFQSANAVIFFIVIVVISVLQMTITGKKEEQL